MAIDVPTGGSGVTQRLWPLWPGVHGTARFSADLRYRYLLTREWYVPASRTRRIMVAIGMNPSGADASWDDATVRRLVGEASRRGFHGLTVLNAYAYRATSPKDLFATEDPFGPLNDYYIRDTLAALGDEDEVLCCWGRIPEERETAMRALVHGPHPAAVRSFAVGDGSYPRHPRGVPRDAPLLPYPRTILGTED